MYPDEQEPWRIWEDSDWCSPEFLKETDSTHYNFSTCEEGSVYTTIFKTRSRCAHWCICRGLGASLLNKRAVIVLSSHGELHTLQLALIYVSQALDVVWAVVRHHHIVSIRNSGICLRLWLGGKESAYNVGDEGSILRLGRSPGSRRKWQPSPVFLPGKFQRQRSLTGYSPWGHQSQTQLRD